MLAPKKIKHRKWQRTDQIRGKATRTNRLAFGSFGLQSLTAGWVSSRQIESARRVMTGYIQRGGKIWIRIFPNMPITKKGSEVPMGKGKGDVDHYVSVVKAGTVMFEMEGVDTATARTAMKLAAYKLPIKCKFIAK